LLCREQAADLGLLMGEASMTSPRLVAIVSETIAVDGFVDYFGREVEIYLDVENNFKKVIGGGKIRKASLSFLISSSFWAAYRRSQRKYPNMKADNQSADGFNLGGVAVISPTKILHLHLEDGVGSLADADALQLIVKEMSSSFGVSSPACKS
jgi:hypothetical protein